MWDDDDEEEETIAATPSSRLTPATQPQPRYGSSDEEDDQDEVDADSLEVSHCVMVFLGLTTCSSISSSIVQCSMIPQIARSGVNCLEGMGVLGHQSRAIITF